MDVLNESDSRVALVTGANRGIGLATVRGLAERGYTTLRYARDLAKGERAAAELARAGVGALPCELDVTDQATIRRLADEVRATYGRLDVLMNNAAILYDRWQSALEADREVVREAMETNVYGAWRMAQRPNLSGLARLADGRACGGQPRPVYGGANTTSRARFSDISTKR